LPLSSRGGRIMKSWIVAIGVGTLLATMAEARAAPAPEAFQPNYVALDDVTLKSADGKQVATVKQGETVAARLTGDGNRERSYSPTDTLEVRTEDGRRGRAPVAAFNRLGSTIEVTDAARQVARSNNRFAFDLYRQTRQQEGNLFLSPASISTALAMTYAGAAGGTRSEMASVLHFDQQ